MIFIKQFFSLLWRGWKKFAHVLGIINTKILLTITYFILLAIAGIIRSLVRADLLDRKMDAKPSYYHHREPFKDTIQTVRRTF
jgi:hypothetical protein